jgi:hypothetical protein
MERRVPSRNQVSKAKEPSKPEKKFLGVEVQKISLTPEKASGQAQINFSKKVTEAFTVKNLPIIYRTRTDKETIRRYYVGFVQFAYAAYSALKWVVILTNGQEEVSLKGVVFDDEKGMHEYLRKELLG